MPHPRRAILALAVLAGFGLAACQPAGGDPPVAAGTPPAAPAPTEAPAAPTWAADAAMPEPAPMPGPAAPPAAAGAVPAPAGPQRVAIVDATGFEKPLPALWVQVPAGWQTRGGVVWNPSAPCGATPGFQWEMQSPDGRQRLQMLPPEAWTWDNLGFPAADGACPRWPITDVRGYLQSFVQRQRPGARILDFRDRNDLIRTPAPPAAGQARSWKEGGEVLIAYQDGGGEVRESIAAVVLFTQTTMAGVMPGEVRQFLSGIAASPVATRAPAGQLDMDLPTRFARSVQPDPQWEARMARHNTEIARQGLKGQAERGRIMADTQREVAEINTQAWRDRDQSSDRLQQASVDSINNVQRYTDPVTGDEVQLDNRYDNAWRTQDGNYLQSNDPNLNPGVDLGVEAVPMEQNE